MTLEERQVHIRGIRTGLLSQDDRERVEALRQLYIEIARKGLLWFDVLGRISEIEAATTHLEGLVELVLALTFGDEWPPDRITTPLVPSPPGGDSGSGSIPSAPVPQHGVS